MKIIELGMHPYADTFIPKSRLTESEPVYPLTVHLDRGVYIHLEAKTGDRYNLYDYSYTSSNSSFSRNHWTEFAEMLFLNKYLNKDSKVVEIGSNDGFLLNIIKKRSPGVLGVDASSAMSEIANKNGIKTLNVVFDHKSSHLVKKEAGSATVIIANNVFNHADNPKDFALGVANVLSKDGVFVFELPYWYYTITNKKFDQIYHEHQTYFTVKYAFNLLKEVGMEITDVRVVDYHGGSIRVFAKKTDIVKKSKLVRDYIKKEEDVGLFDKTTYVKYMSDIMRRRNLILRKIYSIKNKGGKIVAIGAAAKANTFLNFYNLDNKTIDYVTDASPHKQGKYTPLSRIPIVPDEILASYNEVYAIVLTWNLNLETALLKINKKIKFIK